MHILYFDIVSLCFCLRVFFFCVTRGLLKVKVQALCEVSCEYHDPSKIIVDVLSNGGAFLDIADKRLEVPFNVENLSADVFEILSFW